MVLHNSKWDKKATKNYYKKHGIKPPPPKHLRGKAAAAAATAAGISNAGSGSESEEGDNENNGDELHEASSDGGEHESGNENADEHDTDDAAEEKQLPDTTDKLKTGGSETLAQIVMKAAGVTEEDLAQGGGSGRAHRTRAPGTNAWRYASRNKDGYSADDTLAELLAAQSRSALLRQDPDFQALLKERQEEEVFEEDQLRLARGITARRIAQDEQLRAEEEERLEEEERAEEERAEEERQKEARTGKKKVYTLSDLEDSDDEPEKKHFTGARYDMNEDEAEMKSHIKKLRNKEEYYSVQREIDRAATEKSIRQRFAGTGASAVGASQPNKKVIQIGETSKIGGARLKQLAAETGRTTKGAGASMVAGGEEDLDAFLDGLDINETPAASRILEDTSDDEIVVRKSNIPGLDSDSDSDSDPEYKPAGRVPFGLPPASHGINKDQEAWLDNLIN